MSNMEKNNIYNPPKLAEFFFKLFLRYEDTDHRLGDLQEIYEHKLISEGRLKASTWYWLQIILSIPHFLFNNIFWEAAMFKNYIKVAFRNIYKTKFYTELLK